MKFTDVGEDGPSDPPRASSSGEAADLLAAHFAPTSTPTPVPTSLGAPPTFAPPPTGGETFDTTLPPR